MSEEKSLTDDVFIIAEAGVNHNGSLDMALRLVDAAAAAGADAVKFQTFRAESVVTADADKAEYQATNTGKGGTQLDMIRELELGQDEFRKIAEHAISCGIQFMSTPFDEESMQFLVRDIGLSQLKIPSGEITNGPFLLAAANTGLPLIVSSGMSTLDEITTALGVLAFGYLASDEKPSLEAFKSAYALPAGRALLKRNVVLLHCTTQYPAPVAEVNLRAMVEMREYFDLEVGYSDHTQGFAVPIAAAALGAPVIEKHFTLDNDLPGPDHRASLEPHDLAAMVDGIRRASLALGSPDKKPVASELANLSVARRSLVAARKIRKGEVFDMSMIAAKRPGTGLSPMEAFNLVGTIALRDYEPDEMITA